MNQESDRQEVAFSKQNHMATLYCHVSQKLENLNLHIDLILWIILTTYLIAYQMGRLCEGAHEISDIPAPLWLCGWAVGGFMGWVVIGGG